MAAKGTGDGDLGGERPGDSYGVSILSTSTDFEKQPIGKTTAHLADQIRDTLPAHLGGFVKKVSGKPEEVRWRVIRRSLRHAHAGDLQLPAQRVPLVHAASQWP